MTARADLHVHSKHSNRPTEYLLRRLGAAESYREPLAIYRTARERGMDFVTITDHDAISGALEIAHLPGTFVSVESTVAFPEDGCQIHLLVFGITEPQFDEIERLRGNIYELRDYLRSEGILCSVAHPFFRVNERLTLAHLEKLLVLFDRFETINGVHDAGVGDRVREIVSSLTPDRAFELVDRHGIEPWSTTPWRKSFTGGSDDHCGRFAACAWTETPPVADAFSFLSHLRAGNAKPGGTRGSSARLVESLVAIAAEDLDRRLPRLALGARRDPLARTLFDLAREIPRLGTEAIESAIAEALARFGSQVAHDVSRGRFGHALGRVGSLAPLAAALAPFLIAVKAQNKDRDLVRAASERFGCGAIERPRTLWIAESEADLAAPPPVLRKIAAPEALETMVVGSCAESVSLCVHQFAPLKRVPFDFGSEEGPIELRVPPFLKVVEFVERERFSEIVVSSSGLSGLLGLAVARLLSIPLVACPRADLASRVGAATGELFLEELASGYERWFLHRADRIVVASRFERERWLARGIAAERIEVAANEFVGEFAHAEVA